MSAPLETAVQIAVAGRDLTDAEMHAAVGAIMDGEATDAQTAALLTALRMKGEAVAEVVGAVKAMVERCTPVPTTRSGLLDTCGTGGDGLHTFNISTATAIVVAAAGVPVAKHGNRGVSSTSGSADVLKALGVNIELSPEQVGRCIDELGIGFCFAPLVHGAMKHAAPIRRQLGFRTIFNLLGPLTNPAGAEYQLLGVGTPDVAEKLAQALLQLGPARSPAPTGWRAIVVCGNGELDEVSLWGETTAWIVSAGGIRRETWTAATFGLNECRADELTVSSPDQSAAIIRDVIAGTPGASLDIVLANSAAALMAAGRCENLGSAMALARGAISSGDAVRLLARFCELSRAIA